MKRLLQFSLTIATILALVISCAKDEPTPDPIKYTLTVSAGDGGNVSSTGGSYTAGSEVTITATPNSEYVFSGWSNGSTENPIKVTVNSNQTLTANFTKRKYALSITIEGEGTVTEEVISSGKDYDSGTVVRLTAVPSDNWQFTGWTGAVESTELSIDLTISEAKSITAQFTLSNTSSGVVLTNQLVFDQNTGIDLNNLETTFLDVSADIYFNIGEDEFLLLPGTVPHEGPPAPTILMKKENGEWNLHQIYDQVLMKAPRNIKIINENEFVIGDSGEHGNQPWLGNIWWGKITSSGIDWTKVNNDNEMGYFHGVSMGDLNNDGLIDFAGVPNTSADGVTWYTYGIFIQNNDGTFTRNNDFWTPENDMPFTIDIDNVLGDDRNEIITASYGGSSSGWNEDANRIEVYSYEENTQSYQLEFRSDQIDDFGQQVLGATSIIAQDFNNDGIKDISIAREFFARDIDGDGNDEEDISFNSFEVWLSDGIGGFNLSYKNVFPFNELRFREFVVLDANQDGNLDIVLRTNGGTDYFSGDLSGNPDTYWDEIKRAIRLNKSIWLGNGDGTFDFYNTKDLSFEMENYAPSVINPFMRDDKLCFIGNQLSNPNDSSGDLKIDVIEIELDLIN